MMFSTSFQKVYDLVTRFGIHQDAEADAYAVTNFLRFLAFLSGYAQENEDLRQIFKDEDRQEAERSYRWWYVGVGLDNGGRPYLYLDHTGDSPFSPAEMPAIEISRAGLSEVVIKMAEDVIRRLQTENDLPESFLMSAIYDVAGEIRKYRSLINVLKADAQWKCPPEFAPDEVVFEGAVLFRPDCVDLVQIYYLEESGNTGERIVHVKHIRLKGQPQSVEFFITTDEPQESTPQGVLTSDGLEVGDVVTS